jgi:hypothetical protein
MTLHISPESSQSSFKIKMSKIGPSFAKSWFLRVICLKFVSFKDSVMGIGTNINLYNSVVTIL